MGRAVVDDKGWAGAAGAGLGVGTVAGIGTVPVHTGVFIGGGTIRCVGGSICGTGGRTAGEGCVRTMAGAAGLCSTIGLGTDL